MVRSGRIVTKAMNMVAVAMKDSGERRHIDFSCVSGRMEFLFFLAVFILQ